MKKPTKKQSEQPVDDPNVGSVKIGIAHFEIQSFGMVESDIPSFMGPIKHNRSADIIPDDDFLTMRVRFEVTRMPTEGDAAPRLMLWITVIQKFEITITQGDADVKFASSSAKKVKLPHKLVTNLLQIAHTSLRGAIAMLVRGTWFRELIPNPQSMHSLLLVEPEDEKDWLEDSKMLFV